MNSKRKGNGGENEVCRILTAAGHEAHRNEQMYVGAVGNPDVVAVGLEWAHFEIKRTERLNVHEAMRQATRDCAGRVPIVVSRRSREPWMVTMRLDDWLKRIS